MIISGISLKAFTLHAIRYTLHAMLFLLSAAYCFAEEPKTHITADSVQYEKETAVYTAVGSVKVEQDKAMIEANEMKYHEKTSDLFADGDVKYDDQDIYLKAEKAVYNLNTKTGTFYNAEIFSKRDKFYVSGAEIEKKGVNAYFITDASITSCDDPSPAWCFKSSNADIIIGDRLKAKNATFNVQGIPVLYTPYFWAPVITERKTGFLMPVLGYSKSRGFSYRQPFFWAIDENKDATFVLDWYSKRGFGEGAEYRYVDLGGIKGTSWLYHTKDKKLKKDFYELRTSHEKRGKEGPTAYINLNLLSGKNFYREYSNEHSEKIQRFLGSTAELSYPADNYRLYLMSQYLSDLKDNSDDSVIPQRLPELGYVVRPYNAGPVLFSLTTSAANFWRKEGVSGQRLDLYPRFSHSFGDKVVISQNLGLRETAYFLHRNEAEGFKNSVRRETFDYNITALSRFLRDYSSFSHAVEPSLAYSYVPWLKKDKLNAPLFDSTESYSRQSTITLSLANRIFDKGGEFFTLSLSESFNSYERSRPFSPLTVSAAVGRPIQLRGDASYNSYTGRIESINSDLSLSALGIGISLGERYNTVNNTMFYDLGMNYDSKSLYTDLRLWYDAKGRGLRDATFKIGYKKQCWGSTLIVNVKPADKSNNTPSDYSIVITIDLLGLGSLKV